MRIHSMLFVVALALSELLLAGCGNGQAVQVSQNPDGSLIVQLVPASGGGQVPPPPGSTQPAGSTPNLGGGGPAAPATPPPNVSINPPAAPTFTPDANTQAVIAKYHLNLVGADATPDNVAIVTAAAQLYQGRQHTLTIIIQRDESKYPVAGYWYGTDSGATIELYQPQIQHVSDHEIAHDMTLMAMPDAGNTLGAVIQQNADNPATFPSAYSHANLAEAMAETTSFWAEKASGLVASSAWYNPPAAISSAEQPFLADSLKGK